MIGEIARSIMRLPPGRRLLEVLQAGPFAEPDFQPERARDGGRRIEL